MPSTANELTTAVKIYAMTFDPALALSLVSEPDVPSDVLLEIAKRHPRDRHIGSLIYLRMLKHPNCNDEIRAYYNNTNPN